MRNYFVLVMLAILAVTSVPGYVNASGLGDFPSCLNPQGTVKASYTEGTHGIPGDRSTFTGSDVVYQLEGNAKLLQCFCADDGTGIQTHWYKASSLSQQEKDNLVRDGWISIPNGTVWGLDNEVYLAKNLSDACGARAIGGGDLAGTGNSAALYGFIVSGLAFMTAGASRIRKGTS